ncbi:E3 ubiquitin-protein ligase TRIM58 isoform X1 [Sinocyclocheilus rhinocerous]|uniref:E3 ubiquitin-protein ligase TRIM58 isoform X1 n=2 Tax=Sinocyclocheilus rhinocerous TaxID=307959 RepID=UPI0007BA8F6D|nr:PREDICTED: E3 ubiquitin-protein ligase TRIM58-like isoform X1 [Sinocyclocheilus rhinocerous]
MQRIMEVKLTVNAGMASPTSMLAEEQVHCSICLDVFTNPVSIPCGHNFCMACIGSYWKSSALFMCPMCKKTFFKQPDISINTVLREIAEKFKEIKTNPVANLQKTTQPDPGQSPVELPTEMPELIPPNGPWAQVVSCDVCTGPQRQAVKSCLVCLTSYCEEHLKTHTSRFTKHKLIEPVQNLEDRMCKKHERLLELFCKKDQTIVCVLCTEMDHRAHYTVPVEREWTEKKALFRKTEAEVQQMIQERLNKVDDIKHSLELNKSSAQKEIEDSMQVFSDLIRAVQKAQAELVLDIEEKQRKTESWANGQIQELEQEIDLLKLRNTELEYLSHTEDHIHFLQNFPSLMSHPHTKDWSETCVYADACVGTTRRTVLKLEETLTEEVEKLVEIELNRVQKYSVDITFDPDTANPWLQLSEDGRQMRHLGAWQDLADTPERFDTVVITLSREGLSSGRHYWEVQVGEKDDWYIGVARASVNRKGRISVSTAQGYWALAMKKGQEYRVSSSPPLLLSIEPKLKRVGVYVDYEEGQVSFYDVQNKSHIYTFMDSFKEKLFPFFYLYCCDKASDTMMICPVQETSHTKQC